MHPRKVIRDFLGFAGSQYLVRLLLMVRGILAARLLGPSAYGAWNGLMLVVEYGLQSQVGTLQGLDQSVPPRIVDGDAAALTRLKRAGLFNILALGVLFTLATTLYFWRSTGPIRAHWGELGVLVALAIALLTNLINFHNTLLRSHGNVQAVSNGTLLQGLVGALLGVALIPWLGTWGLLYGWLAGTLLALVYMRWRGRALVPLWPAPTRDGRMLLTVGFPMFVYVMLNFVMRSMDRVIILRFLGTESLGFYSLAVMAIGLLMYLPDSIGYVLYPRMLSAYHGAGNDPEAVRDPVERALRLISLLLPMFCALAYLAADDSVLWILPKFREGVPALRILCFGAAALGLGSMSSVVLMTLRRQNVLVPVAVGTTLVGAALMLAAVRAGLGIRGVAWATLFTYGLHSAVMVWFALAGLHEQPGRRLIFLVRLFAPLVLAIPLAYACNAFLPWAQETSLLGVLRLLLGVVLFLGVYAALAVPLARGIGLKQLALEFHLPGLGRWRRVANGGAGR